MNSSTELDNVIDVNQLFQRFNYESYWKLIMDKKYWHLNNPRLFDEQSSPGYLINTSSALFFLLITINQPLSVDYIIALHSVAYPGDTFSKEMRSYGISSINLEAITHEGLVELIEKIQTKDKTLSLHFNTVKGQAFENDRLINLEGDPSKLADLILSNLTSGKWYSIDLARISSTYDALKKTQALISEYQDTIKNATNEEALIIIAKFIRDLHQYHPFEDGNGRTFIFLLLNKLLIENHLDPTIIAIPGKFSGCSVKQLVDEIIQGQEIFRSLCTSELPSEENFLTFLSAILGQRSEEVISFADNLILSLFRDFDALEVKDFITSNIDYLYDEKIVKTYDQTTLDLVFTLAPPINLDLTSLFQKAVNVSNLNFLTSLILWRRNQSDDDTQIFFENLSQLSSLITKFPWAEVEKVFSSTYLNLSDNDIFALLKFDRSLGFKQSHYLFRNLLINGKTEAFQALFEKCTEEQKNQLLTMDMRDINGLQLVAICCDRSFFMKCCNIINNTNKVPAHEWLHQNINTKYDEEKQLLKTTNYHKLVKAYENIYLSKDRLLSAPKEKVNQKSFLSDNKSHKKIS